MSTAIDAKDKVVGVRPRVEYRSALAARAYARWPPQRAVGMA